MYALRACCAAPNLAACAACRYVLAAEVSSGGLRPATQSELRQGRHELGQPSQSGQAAAGGAGEAPSPASDARQAPRAPAAKEGTLKAMARAMEKQVCSTRWRPHSAL